MRLPPNTRVQRTRSSRFASSLAADAPPVGRTEAPIEFHGPPGSPGQHVSQAGRGEQRREVSREDRLPTR